MAATPDTRRTQVCVIGCGPAGLLLAEILRQLYHVDAVVVESRSRESIRAGVRAGVVEDTVFSLFESLLDAASRGPIRAAAQLFRGISLAFDGDHFSIDTKYWMIGQNFLVSALIDTRLRAAGEDSILFESQAIDIQPLPQDSSDSNTRSKVL